MNNTRPLRHMTSLIILLLLMAACGGAQSASSPAMPLESTLPPATSLGASKA